MLKCAYRGVWLVLALLATLSYVLAQEGSETQAEITDGQVIEEAEHTAEGGAHAEEAAADHAEGDHAAGGGHAAGGHGEHHAHIGEKGVNTQAEEFKGDLAIFTFIVFVLLAAILWKFAWGPIMAGLDKREKRIADDIAAAKDANEEAKRLLAQYEQKLADAQVEVRGILDEARRDAQHTQQEILAKAREDARAERDRALREIDTATQGALKELAEKSTNLAIELAGKIVRAELKPADHARLIEDAVKGFSTPQPSKN